MATLAASTAEGHGEPIRTATTLADVRRAVWHAPAIFTVGTKDPLLDDTLFMEARWRTAGRHATELADLAEAPHGLISPPMTVANAALSAEHDFLRPHHRSRSRLVGPPQTHLRGHFPLKMPTKMRYIADCLGARGDGRRAVGAQRSFAHPER